ncbi:MAG: GNAT family N-acetyltransferase, partial [Ferruginibacter sp.]
MSDPKIDKLFTGDLHFENKLVVLRPLTEADIDGFRRVVYDEAIWKYFAIGVGNNEALDGFIRDAVQHRQERSRVTFTAIDKASGQIAGSTSFGNFSFRDKRVEIGWTWLAPGFQKTGLNRSNKYLLLKYAFEELDMERVEFKTDVLNQAARKGLLGIGATEEGVLRSHT